MLAVELAILALAFGLRVYGLGWRSLWFDEGYTAWIVAGELDGLVATTAEDIHPPFYYLLVRLWLGLAGPANETTLRFVSALAGTLAVALIARLAGDMYGRRAAIVAGLLAAVSPFLIVYSQEARMYGLLVALETAAVWCLWRGLHRSPVGWWFGWAAATVLALYTHYFAAFALIAQVPVLLAALVGRNRVRATEGVVGATTLIALLYLPWLVIALRQLIGYGAEWIPAPTLERMTSETVRAFATGDVAGGSPDWLLAALAAAGALALLALVRASGATLVALLWLAVPIGAVFFASIDRPMFHVRYLILALPAVYLLIAGGTAAWRAAPGWLLAALAVPLLVLHLGGLAVWEATPKDAAREAYALVESRLGETDVVLYDAKHPFLHYAAGDERWVYPFATDGGLRAAVDDALVGRRHAWLVHWRPSTADAQDYIPWLLDGRHRLVERFHLRNFDVLHYALNEPGAGSRIDWKAKPTTFEGGLALLDWGVLRDPERPWLIATGRVDARAGEGTSLALRWRRPVGPLADLSAFVVAVDGAGRTVAKIDRPLLDAGHRPTGRWPDGEYVTYHRLPVPLGTPPGEYTLRLGLYETGGQRRLSILDSGRPVAADVELGRLVAERGEPTELDAAVQAAAVGSVAGEPPVLAPGVRLASAHLDGDAVAAGQTVAARLCWYAEQAPLPDLAVRVRLAGTGLDRPAETSGRPVYGRYPATRWQSGETVCEWRELRVPTSAPPGRYAVTAALEPGSGEATVGEVDVQARTPSAPAEARGTPVQARFAGGIELVAYELSVPLAPGAQPTLTLYWRTDDDLPVAYTVFAQLLSEADEMLAQHDAPPDGGARPTTTWLPGEVVADPHPLVVPAARGRARLLVGLYDPRTLARLPLADGADAVVLFDGELGQ